MYYFDCSRGPLLTFMIPLLQVFWQDPQYTLNESQSIAKECQAISRCLAILVKRLHPKTGGFSFLHLFQIIRCFIPSTFYPSGTNISCPMEKDPIIFPSTLGVCRWIRCRKPERMTFVLVASMATPMVQHFPRSVCWRGRGFGPHLWLHTCGETLELM